MHFYLNCLWRILSVLRLISLGQDHGWCHQHDCNSVKLLKVTSASGNHVFRESLWYYQVVMDWHNYMSSAVEPAALEWFLNILHCLWTSVFIVLFVSEPEEVNWLVTVGERFNWQVIMDCNRSNKEAWSRSRPRADRTRWLMSDSFLNCIQQQRCTAWTCSVCETMQDFFHHCFIIAKWNHALITVDSGNDLVNQVKKKKKHYIENTQSSVFKIKLWYPRFQTLWGIWEYPKRGRTCLYPNSVVVIDLKYASVFP